MSLIKLNNVSKKYLNIKLNLIINKNETIIINGINGIGKSTLLKLITNYIKPDMGLIERNIKKISYLEENFKLPESLKVKDYIKIIEDLKSDRYDNILAKKFNIPFNKEIRHLSKGNKQKLAILTTFIGEYELCLLDEPLNGLDSESIKILINYIKNCKDKSFVIISHQYKLFKKIATREIELW